MRGEPLPAGVSSRTSGVVRDGGKPPPSVLKRCARVCVCGEPGSRADPRTEVGMRLWEGPDGEPTPADSVQHVKKLEI